MTGCLAYYTLDSPMICERMEESYLCFLREKEPLVHRDGHDKKLVDEPFFAVAR